MTLGQRDGRDGLEERGGRIVGRAPVGRVASEPMEIVLVRDRGAWADRMGEMFSGRGHRVRQIRAPLGARAARRLFHALAPRGVVIVTRPRGLGGLARIPSGWRVVAVCREPRRPGSPTHRRIMRWGRDADRFLAQTAEEADGWARDGLSNAVSMPDPLPVPERCARLSEPVVVATGGPEHEYGLDLLLESWAELAPRHPTWRLSLPDCPASTATYRHAVRLGIADAVDFGGYVVVGGRGPVAGGGGGRGVRTPVRDASGRGDPRRDGTGPGPAVRGGPGRFGRLDGDYDSGGRAGDSRYADLSPPARVDDAEVPGPIRVGGSGRPAGGPQAVAEGPVASAGDGTAGGPPRHRVGGPADPLIGAAVFALPARTSEYPAALGAAMARGLPAVAYDCSPGVRELVTDGVDGLIVPPGNTREFAAALEWLIMNEGIRRELAGSARESARRFAPEAVADRWERLFSLLFR